MRDLGLTSQGSRGGVVVRCVVVRLVVVVVHCGWLGFLAQH